MKIKEISVGISGVIPICSYENLRPSFSAMIEVQEGDNPDEVMKQGTDLVNRHFKDAAERAKIDLIEKQYSNIKFRERNGKKYPRISSIMGYDKAWKISEDELMQYGSRGRIVHKVIELYLTTRRWVEPEAIVDPEIQEDILIVKNGSLGLHWDQCSHKEFYTKFIDDIVVESIEGIVFNDEHRYTGRSDIKGLFKGKRSIMDNKTGAYEMAQLAGYAVCEDNIEQLVVFPVGKTNNKCGYANPVICTDIMGEFKKLLYKREKFKQRFGI